MLAALPNAFTYSLAHDIEEDPAARGEMQAALERVGRGGGSIPVIVWRGKVFVGFDQRGLEAMRSAGP